MLTWLWIFVLIFLADVFWVLCVRRVQNNDPFWAGVWAIGIFLPTAVVTVGYVNDPWLFIPACLGHFTGTYVTTKWEAKISEHLKAEKLQNMLDSYDWEKHSQYMSEDLAYWQLMEADRNKNLPTITSKRENEHERNRDS